MLYHHTTRPALAALALCAPSALANDPVRVVTDIAPIHSLAAQVMGDLGAPDLLVGPSDSPHNFALRPSQANALQDADAVFWVGPDLTPWLESPLAELNKSGVSVRLLEVSGALELEPRDGPIFGAADHDDHGDHEDEHKDEHGDEGHAHKDEHEKKYDDHGHDEHAHGDVDPHAWLSPDNAALWLTVIADTLSKIAPEHEATFNANAAAAQTALSETVAEIKSTLAPVQGQPFVVYHDAYQYFENHFDLNSLGSVALSDAAAPSPKRIAELREHIQEDKLACAFSEPQLNTRLLDTVLEGEGVKVSVIDPLGSTHTPGPDLYSAMLRDVGQAFATCAD